MTIIPLLDRVVVDVSESAFAWKAGQGCDLHNNGRPESQ